MTLITQRNYYPKLEVPQQKVHCTVARGYHRNEQLNGGQQIIMKTENLQVEAF